MMGLPGYPLCILLLWPLGACGARQRGHLLRANHLQGVNLTVKPPAVELDPAMAAGMKQFFALQFVGLQKGGINQPRSPLSHSSGLPKNKFSGKGARVCMTAGPVDRLQGYSLSLQECSDADLTPPGEKVDRKRQNQQAFHFLNDGRIRNRITGLCVRRMACGLTPVYDLGSCSEDRTGTMWTVSKAVANQIHEKEFLGYPLVAVVKDLCNMCGPYQLLQKCKGVPMSSNWGCGDSAPEPGWTKLPASIASEPKDEEEDYDPIGDAINSVDENMEFDGIAADTEKNGHCGTYLVDGSSIESWFYFLKVGV